MRIKPLYPKKIFRDPYINGLYNGILIGFSLVLVFSKYKTLGMVGIGVGFMAYMLYNYDY